MTRLSEIRFIHNVPGLTSAGNLVLRDSHAEMFLDQEVILCRRRDTRQDFIVPLSGNIVYVKPKDSLAGVFTSSAPGATPPAPEPTPGVATGHADDTVRMVKINGRIVERKGPPKDDELEALTRPAGTGAAIFEAGDSEE